MDTVTIIVLLTIVAAPIGLMLLLERRDRRARRAVPTAEGGDDQSLRERTRAEQEGEGPRGEAAGMAYGSGIGGGAP